MMRCVRLSVVSCLLVVGAAGPAAADVDLTVNVVAGELSIAVPAAADLGFAVPGGTLTVQLGPVEVVDDRSQLAAVWLATVAASDFTTGAAGPSETIPAAAVAYSSGPATTTAGEGTFEPGQLSPAAAVPLSAGAPAFSKSSGDRSNSADWNPTLILDIPMEVTAGSYRGTITHSVA